MWARYDGICGRISQKPEHVSPERQEEYNPVDLETGEDVQMARDSPYEQNARGSFASFFQRDLYLDHGDVFPYISVRQSDYLHVDGTVYNIKLYELCHELGWLSDFDSSYPDRGCVVELPLLDNPVARCCASTKVVGAPGFDKSIEALNAHSNFHLWSACGVLKCIRHSTKSL